MAEQHKSDLSRAFSEDGALKTHVGGQALIEGVMMRGKYNWAAAVREPDGNIYVEEHDLASGKNPNSWLHKPIIRGCTALVESLILGFRALSIAVDHAYEDEEEEAKSGKAMAEKATSEGLRSEASQPSLHPSDAAVNLTDASRSTLQEAKSGGDSAQKLRSQRFTPPDSAINLAETSQPSAETPNELKEKGEKAKDEGMGGVMGVSMVLGIIIGVALFIVAPVLLTDLIVRDRETYWFLWNVVDGVLRVAIFVLYMWLVGRMSDMRRMYAYHGAEHKTIHCYEHGLPLTPENARSFPRLHVRCGTAFLVMVLIIAIIVYSIIPVPAIVGALGIEGVPATIIIICVRIIFFPLIAGISYEITVRWAGSHPDNPVVKVILWPGMQMQYLTTNEPDDEMLECAIAAMQRVLDCEEARAAEDARAAEIKARASAIGSASDDLAAAVATVKRDPAPVPAAATGGGSVISTTSTAPIVSSESTTVEVPA